MMVLKSKLLCVIKALLLLAKQFKGVWSVILC